MIVGMVVDHGRRHGMKWYIVESTFLRREVVFVSSGFRSSGNLSTKKQGMKFLWRKNLGG